MEHDKFRMFQKLLTKLSSTNLIIVLFFILSVLPMATANLNSGKEALKESVLLNSGKEALKESVILNPLKESSVLNSDKEALKESSVLNSDMEALKEFSTIFPPGSKLEWSGDDICSSWSGIGCNQDGTRVTAIRLDNMGLRGPIPGKALTKLTALEILDLSFNSLSGPIPFELQHLSSLTTLNLGHNNLEGQIPYTFPYKVKILDLSNNKLTGEVPSLTLPDMKSFDISSNNLNGKIPSSLKIYPAESFEKNVNLCGPPLRSCMWWRNWTQPDLQTLAYLIVAVCFLYSFYDIIRAIWRIKARRNTIHGVVFINSRRQICLDLDRTLDPNPLTEVIGVGSLVPTYRMVIGNHFLTVAVKRLDRLTDIPRDFRIQLEYLQNMRFDNPYVSPVCAFTDNLLAYPYFPRGSLERLLYENRGVAGRIKLPWRTRVFFTIQIAKGIASIHQPGPLSIHGNIKSSNVLIGPWEQPVLSEAGLYRLMTDNLKRGVGYGAPEVRREGVLSRKGDVYSFGIMLLELLTGKHPIQNPWRQEMQDLRALSASSTDFFDEEIVDAPAEEKLMMLNIAKVCIRESPRERPLIGHVLMELERI